MSGLSAKNGKVGLSEACEPVAKKAKIGLSEASEPLTQRDVILFQKEALFRSLNEYRTKFNLSNQHIKGLKAIQDRFNEQLATLCGVMRSIARVLSRGGDEIMQQRCSELLSGSDDDIINGAAELATVVVGRLLKECKLEKIDWEHWQTLEVLNGKLTAENKQLVSELETIKNYYSDLLHKTDREDSISLKRVFKLEDEHTEPTCEESKSSLTAADENKVARPISSENNSTAIPLSDQKSDNNKELEGIASQTEQELKIADFEAQIKVLEEMVKKLTAWKDTNEQELIKLRQSSMMLLKSQSSGSSTAGLDGQALEAKLEKLAEENRELTQVNDAYLGKFKQLSAEQEVFTNSLSSEFQSAQETLRKHNSSLEKDLVRIRTARDELLSKIAVLEAQKSKSDMLTDLQKILEVQQEKLREMGHRDLEPTQDVLMKELQDLEKAFKELSQYSNKKYLEYINQESIMSKLTVEKTKADQKYFAAMRSKDSILIENKNLSKNLNKCNELIQQLKEIEKTFQVKIENLNKQLQILQMNEKRLKDSNKATSLKIMDLSSQLAKSKKACSLFQQELNKTTEEKTKLESKLQYLEMETGSLQIKLNHQEVKTKKLYKTLVSNGGDNGALAQELDNFRTVVYCSLCSKNWKNTVIKTCGHVFCADCCKERLAARMRKCPTCNKPFSSSNLLAIHF